MTTISEIAKQYKVDPQIVYSVIRRFEHCGVLQVERVGRKLQLDNEARELIELELERRGHR